MKYSNNKISKRNVSRKTYSFAIFFFGKIQHLNRTECLNKVLVRLIHLSLDFIYVALTKYQL
jgi:hypothetical protein